MSGRPEPPTGEQHELHADDQHAVVVELGAGLRSYSVGGVELLDTYGAEQAPPACHGEVLLPFPNRIDQGRYRFDGREHQLPLTEPERGNAVHGLTRFMNWQGSRRAGNRVVMSLVLRPSKGYPFTLGLAIDYSLSGRRLEVRTIARNLGTEALPFAAGYHPYFNVGTGTIDAAILQLPASSYLPTDERLIPTGRAHVAGTQFDFRDPRPIGQTALDTCFTDLAREPDGFARVRLEAPGGAPSLALELDRHHDYVQVYTSDTLPDSAAVRRAVAIEPMTAPPNAFRTGQGVTTLLPGQSFESSYAIAASV